MADEPGDDHHDRLVHLVGHDHALADLASASAHLVNLPGGPSSARALRALRTNSRAASAARPRPPPARLPPRAARALSRSASLPFAPPLLLSAAAGPRPSRALVPPWCCA